MTTFYITFPSTCDLLKLEDALEKQGISVYLKVGIDSIQCYCHYSKEEVVHWFVLGWIASAMSS